MHELFNLKNYFFNSYSIPYFVVGVFVLFLGIRVYIKRRKSQIGVAFFTLMFSISTWLITNGITFTTSVASLAFVWQKVSWSGVILLAPGAYFFISSVLGKERKKEVVLFYILSLLFLLSLYLNLIVSGVEKYYWGYDSIGGKFENLFLGYFAFLLFVSFYELVAVIRDNTSSARKKSLAKNLLAGMLVAFTAVWDFLPLLGHPVYPVGFIPFTVWAVHVNSLINKFNFFKITPEIAAKTIIDTVPDMLFVCDHRGIVKIANNLAVKTLRYSKEKVVDTSITKFLPVVEKVIKTAKGRKFHEEKIVGMLTNLVRKDERKLSISLSVAELENSQGDMVGLVIICHDISKLQKMRREKDEALKLAKKKEEELVKQLEETEKTKKAMLNVLEDLNEEKEKLEEASAKDEAVLLAIGDGLVVVDSNGSITLVNQAFEKMLGWKSNEVIGKRLFEVVPMINEKGEKVPKKERLRPLVLMPGKKVSETRTSYFSTTETYYFVRKDGSKFPVTITSTPIILEKKIIGAVEVFRDVTKEKEIDKAKSEFVSLASHQLRTPLATVNWYSEVLLNEKVGNLNKKQKEYMKEINHGNRRMIYLVNALLNVSRIELGTFEINPEPVDVPEVVEETLSEVKPRVKLKNINIRKQYQKNIPKLRCDRNLLTIVFENLISNAVKYTPENGTVTISLSSDDVKFDIAIRDTGIGIPKHQQQKIFSKLFRADNVKKLETDGSGLGLYIVKSILDKAGGTITFRSREGKGTEFKITFERGGMKPQKGVRKLSRIEK